MPVYAKLVNPTEEMMRIDFDTENPAELNAVATLIEALQASTSLTPVAAPAPAPVAAPALSGGGSAPTAPVPAPPPATVTATGVETDKNGLPWDKRIHSDPPKQNADGSWRSKRNLDDATKAAVEAELRNAMGAPAVVPTPPAAAPEPTAAEAFAPASASPPAAPVPVSAPTAPPPIPAPVATAPAPVAATSAASPPPPPAAAAVQSFADVMKKVTGLQTAGLMTMDDVTANCQALGLASVRDLMVRPDMIPAFDALLPVAG